MKIDELVQILGSLKAEGLEDIDCIEHDAPNAPWYYLKGPRFYCAIPDESNDAGEPFVELKLKKPIVLNRQKAQQGTQDG